MSQQDSTTRGRRKQSRTHEIQIVQIPLEGGEVIEATMNEKGAWVNLGFLCGRLKIDTEGQRQRLDRTPWATTCIMQAVAQDGKLRDVTFIHIDSFPMWLATIDHNRVDPESQGPLILFQRQAARAVADFFLRRCRERPIPEAHTAEWELERREGTKIRNQLTSILQMHGVVGRGYADVTNAIYEQLWGGNASYVYKKLGGTHSKGNPRELMTEFHLTTVKFIESLLRQRIEMFGLNGNKACTAESSRVSHEIARSIIKMLKGPFNYV